MEKVSVIIPTFNRFKNLLNTIKSVKEQTYSNIEIIIINDNSTQTEYYEYNWDITGVIMIHLAENTKKIFGFGYELISNPETNITNNLIATENNNLNTFDFGVGYKMEYYNNNTSSNPDVSIIIKMNKIN